MTNGIHFHIYLFSCPRNVENGTFPNYRFMGRTIGANIRSRVSL